MQSTKDETKDEFVTVTYHDEITPEVMPLPLPLPLPLQLTQQSPRSNCCMNNCCMNYCCAPTNCYNNNSNSDVVFWCWYWYWYDSNNTDSHNCDWGKCLHSFGDCFGDGLRACCECLSSMDCDDE